MGVQSSLGGQIRRNRVSRVQPRRRLPSVSLTIQGGVEPELGQLHHQGPQALGVQPERAAARFAGRSPSTALVAPPLPHRHDRRRVRRGLRSHLRQEMSEHAEPGRFDLERGELTVHRPAMLRTADGTLAIDRKRQHLGFPHLLEMESHRVGVQMETLGYLQGGQSLPGLGHLLVDRLSRRIRQHLQEGQPVHAVKPTPALTLGTVLSLEAVRGAMRGVIDPELGADLVDLGMYRRAEIGADGEVTVHIALTTAGCPLRTQLQRDVTERVGSLPGVTRVHVRTSEMTATEKKELMARARRRASENPPVTEIPGRTRVLAVSSGKGGVGKSSVTVNLAAGLANRGLTVGLLDADIAGFSVPRMLGMEGRLKATRVESGDEPGSSRWSRPWGRV